MRFADIKGNENVVDAFRSMVEANLFTRPLATYDALGGELRRYRSVK